MQPTPQLCRPADRGTSTPMCVTTPVSFRVYHLPQHVEAPGAVTFFPRRTVWIL